MEKNVKKNMHIYVQLNHSAIYLKLTYIVNQDPTVQFYLLFFWPHYMAHKILVP